jgi:hypothetical protein
MSADHFHEIGLQTGEVDRPAFEDAVRQCYEHASIPWHGNVAWTTSPLVVAAGAPVAALLIALRRLGHGAEHDAEMRAVIELVLPPGVRTALWQGAAQALEGASGEWLATEPAPMDAAAELAVEGAVAGRLRTSMGLAGAALTPRATLHAMRLAVHASVQALLELAPQRTAVQAALRHVIARSWYHYMSGQRRFAFGLLFDGRCGEGELRDLESTYRAAANAACCWYPHREFVLVCDGPKEIHLEPVPGGPDSGQGTHQLHRTGGAAISWSDGWGVHAVHGRYQAVCAPPLVSPQLP